MDPNQKEQGGKAQDAQGSDSVEEKNRRIVQDLQSIFKPLVSRLGPEDEPAVILTWPKRAR